MHLTKEKLEQTERIKRLNIVNSITGIKPANLIGTINKEGLSNLAIFSSIVHLGSNPALIGLIVRPQAAVKRHTFENLVETECYTINHIHESFTRKAHYTSAKFEKNVSEFEKCELTEEYLFDFTAPFVKESQVKMGLKLEEIIPLRINNTTLVIGSIEHLLLPDKILSDKGQVDLSQVNDVGISGLNRYYGLRFLEEFPYARTHELPEF